MADVYNITIDKYATFSFEMVYSDNTGSPIDLTSYTADMQIRAQPNGGTLYDSFDETSGITLGTVDGSVAILITSTDTSSYSWSDAVYDILLTSPDGERIRLVEGSVHINPGVTQ